MSRHGPASRECREIFELLSEYLDGELDPSMCERMDDHMSDCPPCVAFLDSLRDTVKLIREVEAPALPDEVRRRVVEAHARLQRGE